MSDVIKMTWEDSLIALAVEAQNSYEEVKALDGIDPRILDLAYQDCESITREHSRTFFMASGLLPENKRRAARALYAFCRISDDLVDDQRPNAIKLLTEWRNQTIRVEPVGENNVALAWAHTCQQYKIPWRYAEQLIDGVAMDLQTTRYQTFDELAHYCYGVACTVGLMSMHIVGFLSQDAIPYAIRLGVALQMTNILRDVGEDWQLGRVYLPQDELEEFGLSELDIERGEVNDRWREFMKFQVERTRRLYQESFPGIALLDKDGRFAIGAAAELYRAILDSIEQNDYNVFNRRAYIGKLGKLSRLPGIWWRARNGLYMDLIPA